MMVRKKRKKRGYPVGILVGFDEQSIHIWKLFSESFKKHKSLALKRKWKNSTEQDFYHYFQDLLDLLRPLIDSGLKSIFLIAPKGNKWPDEFLNHIRTHHRWLTDSRGNNQVCFEVITGKGTAFQEIMYLLEKETTKEIIKKVTFQEAYFLMQKFEKSINKESPNLIILYGLREIEEFIYRGGKKDDSVADEIDYLLLTSDFLENHKQKNRIYRLKQIANNKGIITKVISEESTAGDRINQFGGILCFKTAEYY